MANRSRMGRAKPWTNPLRMVWGLALLLTVLSVRVNAQTAPASITVGGQCLSARYVLEKFQDNYEGTGRPAYVTSSAVSATVTVTLNGVPYTGLQLDVHYEPAGPAWVLALDGGTYLSNSSTALLPPTSGWVVVSDPGGLGSCTGSAPLNVVTGTVTVAPAAIAAVCAGTPVSLTATPTSIASPVTYTWASSPAGFSGSGAVFTQNAPSVSSSTTYIITVTATSGVSSATASASVTVNPAPGLVVGTAVAPTTCAGTNGSIPFTTTNLPDGSYSLSYSGAGSPKTVVVSGNAFSLTGLAAGTYSSFSITNGGCTGSVSTSRMLTDPPAPIAIVGADQLICSASTATLSATATNGTGVWSVVSGPSTSAAQFNNTASASAVFTPAGGPGAYTLRWTVSNGSCPTATDDVVVTFGSVPTLTLGGSTNPTTCAGTNGSIAFTTNLTNGTYSLTYTGSGSPKTVTVSGGAFSLTGLAAGTYSSFSVTNNGCVGSVATPVTLTNPPTPTLLPGSSVNPTTCSGTDGSIPFTTTNLPDGVYSLTYTGAGSPKPITVTGNAFSLTGLAAGTYSSFSVISTGCVGSVATSRTLTNPPAPTLTLGSPVSPTTCGGTTGSIPFTTTNLPDGIYSLTYTGAGSPKNVTVSGNAFSLTGLAAGTYSSFSIINTGCVGSVATQVTLNGLVPPALTLSSTATLCFGQVVSLSATSGFSSYTFTSTTGFIGSGPANTTAVTGLAANTYSFSVAATAPNGCTNTASTSVTVVAIPVPTLAASGTLTCAQTSVSLTAGGGGTYTFGGMGIINTSANSATVNAPGTFSVTVTTAGCSSTTSVTVSQDISQPAPSDPITSVQNFTTCQNSGTSVVLVANCASGIYKWSDNSTASSVSIPSSATGSFPYSVSCVGANGCISAGVSATAVVKPKPAAPTLTPPPTTSVCEPGSLSIVVSAVGTPAITVTRLFMGSTGNFVVNGNVTLSLPGNYTLSGFTTLNGCQSDNVTPLTGLTVYPQPNPSSPITSPQNFTSYSNGPSVVLVANCASGIYKWSDNSTASSVTIPSSATGSFPYSVSCASANGCLSTGVSATAVILANQPPVLNAPFAPLSTTVGENFSFQIPANAFTDPDNGTLTYSATNRPAWLNFAANTRTLSGSVASAGSFTVTITATDPFGASASGPLVINVSPLPTGFYLLPPTYNCQTGAFTFRVSGADKTPIQYMAEGITPWSGNANQVVSAALRANPGIITIYARQRGVTISRVVDLRTYCPAAPTGRIAAAPDEVPLSLTIQGNPIINGLLEAEVRGAEGQRLQVTLTSETGRAVATRLIESAGSVERLAIPVAHQPAGLLLLRVSTPTQVRIQKVIKQ